MAVRAPSAADSLQRLEFALAREPGNGLLRVQQAQCLLVLRRVDEALASAALARRLADQHPETLEALGAFYTMAQQESLALDAYDHLLALAPHHAGGLFNRAAVRRFTGDLAGAEADYDAVIRANPRDYEAYHNRSNLRGQTRESNHIAELDSLLQHPIAGWRGEVQVRYALAKEHEDIGEYRESWQQLATGATLRRKHMTYDISTDLQTVEWIRAAFPEAVTAPTGCPGNSPIFILGLPRSGTTLVERIVSSHSDVAPGGELNHFTAALLEAIKISNGGRTPARQELIAAAARVDFAALGRSYLERTRALSSQKPRFTDKLPLNYLYCGLIRRALPDARIVHVTRHPLAVCHAMFKTLFRQGYPFSYDLGEIGQYYLGYRRLMQHWREVLPGAIHDVSYEELIAGQEVETRRLLAFCGLDWEERCLSFERNPAPTVTASASQVRRPLYDSSVELWKNYDHQLSGLRLQLQTAGVDVP
jgi:Sulfotransferase family